jgi:hypothetical protein
MKAVDPEKARSDQLDVLLTYIREDAATQRAQITALDAKANFGLATAGLLTTAVVGVHSAFRQAYSVDPTKPAVVPVMVLRRLDPATAMDIAFGLTVVAFITFLWIVWSSYQAYKVRDFDTVPNGQHLVDHYWNYSANDLKAMLAVTIPVAIAQNDHLVNQKIKWVRRVIQSLVFEAALLLAITAVQLAV